MSGTFRSTDAATFMVPYPKRTSTTGAAAALAYASSFGTASSGFTCVISRPTGADLNFTLNSLPAGITWDFVGQNPVASIRLNMAASLFTTAGVYHCSIIVTADASYRGEADNVQWGGWADTVAQASVVTDAATAAAQATIAATQSTAAAASAATAAAQSTTAATQSTTAATQSTTAATQATTAATQATQANTWAQAVFGLLTKDMEIANDELILYDTDGTTPLVRWDVFDITGAPTSDPAAVVRKVKTFPA